MPTTEFHLEIKPLPCYLRKEFLFDQDLTMVGSIVTGRIVEIVSYPGQHPTCVFVSRVGKVYRDLPVEAFRWAKFPENKPATPTVENPDLFICPGKTILAYETRFFKSKKLWTKLAKRVTFGHYVFGLSWPNQNQTAVLMAMNDGSYQIVNNFIVSDKRPKF